MQAEGSVSRRDMLKTFVAGAAIAAPALANAEIDYANLPYLGGSDKIDVNNANIRVYTKLPGMYPSIAGIIAKNGPYQTVEDIYKLPKLSAEQKEIVKKYEKNLVALEPAPEYQEDIFNNGLYR
ncbi:hypothetical protein GUITHDRAFT_70798 [Guillardia theta CCMP2712]|uniref:Photosystem II 12 kDa extrinsic protein n=1 Tax=Guillardia theta (strain CCMP2712) TaxID=905079 RepID=L1JC51_GUITC|nr:hypothetical protein GUITHDRAFT_70798 [Guillardia theta CCMP2712]EKX46101.1 hypothetical protein GUITHDRAFT_70798 [Guillardia theta CCMP2712]|eukprot:XP_005833081.1 hypothetical protein GUITHDRAFT_70798 [Guillardia theta CCMP2712]